MGLPRWLARVNRKVANPILRRVPSRLSPFATVHHVGRRSGRSYEIPLVAFRTPTGFLLTPTYGPDTDWVRNTLAAGSFAMKRHGIRVELDNVRLVNRGEANSGAFVWKIEHRHGYGEPAPGGFARGIL